MADDPLSLLDSLTAPLKAVGEGVSTALGSILDATEKQRQRSAETAATIQGTVEQANSPLANVLQINQHLTDAAPDAAEYQKRVSHAQERGLRVPHSSAALKGMLPTNIAPKHWASLGEYAYDPEAFGLQQSQDGARWMQPRNEPLPKPEIVDVSPGPVPKNWMRFTTRGMVLDAQESMADLFDTVERKLNERQSATPHESTVEGGAPDWSAMSPKLAQAGFVPVHAVPPTDDPAATAQFMVENHRPGLGQTTPEAARAEAAGTDDLPLWAMPGVKLLTVGGNLGKAAGEAYRQFVDNPFDVATPDVKAQRAVDEKAYAQQLSEFAKHAKGQYETLAALSRDPTQAADYRAMAKNIDRWIPVAVRAQRDPTFLKPEQRETLAEFGFPGYSNEYKATDQGFGIAPKSETTIKNPHLRAAAEWAGIQDYYKPRKEGESWSIVPSFGDAMRSMRDVFAGNFMMALHVLDTLGGDPNMSAEQAWEKTKDLTSGFAGGMAGMFAPILGAAALDKDSLSAIQRQIQHDPFGWTVAANAAAGAARGWSRRAVEGFVEGSGKLRVLGPELAKMQDRIFDDSIRRTVHGQGRDYVGDFAQAAGKTAARLTPDAIENYLADKVLPKVVDAAGKVGDAMRFVPVTATGAASLAGLILDKLTQKKGLGFYRMLIHAPWHAVDEASKEVQAEYRNAMGTDDIRLAEMGEALPRGSVKAKEKLYREMHSAAPGTMIDQTGYDALLYMSKSAAQATAEAAKSLLSEADKTLGRPMGIVELPTYELDKPNAQYRLRPEVDAVAKWAMAERNNPAHPAYERQAMGQIVSAANDALGMVGYLNQHQGVQKALEFSRDVTERMAAQGDKPKFGVEQADFNAAQLGVDVAEQHVNQLTQVLGSPKEVERVVRETQRSVDRVADALKRAKGDARQAAAVQRQIAQEINALDALRDSVGKDAAKSAEVEAMVAPIRRNFQAMRDKADSLFLGAQRRGQTMADRVAAQKALEQLLPSDADVARMGATERQQGIADRFNRRGQALPQQSDAQAAAAVAAPFVRAMERMERQQARGRVKEQIADWMQRPYVTERLRARGATAAWVANQLRAMAARDEKAGTIDPAAAALVRKAVRSAEAMARRADKGDVYRAEAWRLSQQAQGQRGTMTPADVAAARRMVAEERRLLTRDERDMARAEDAGRVAGSLGSLLAAAEDRADAVRQGVADPSAIQRRPLAVRSLAKMDRLGEVVANRYGKAIQSSIDKTGAVSTLEGHSAMLRQALDLVQQHAKELDKGISAKDKAVALLDDLRAVRSAVKPDALRQSTAIAEHYEPTWDQIKQLNADRITEMNARKDPAKPEPNEIATEFLEAHPQWLEGGTKLRTNNAAGVHGAATPSWLTNSFNKRKVPYSERVRRFGLVESTDVVRNRMLQDAVSVNQMARNYAIARLAPKGVVSHIDGPGMIKMPDDSIEVSVGGEKLSIPKWGELAGKYVNEDLYYSLVSDDVFAREASGAWGKLNSAFKFAKVPLAPYASVRNGLTNLLVFAPLVGMEMWNPKNARAYALAFKDLMSAKHNRSEVWKSLLKKGTFNADYMHGEMGVQSAADLGGVFNAVLTTLEKTADMLHVRDASSAARFGRAWLANAKKTVGSAYSFGDDVFRLAYGHKLHEQGIPHGQAGKEAADSFTNYSEVPGFVRFLSHPGAAGMLNNSSARLGAGLLYFATGLPFLTFPVAAGKLGLAKMRENPMALARIGALAHAANLSMLGDAGLSEDDWDQIRKALPAAMRDASLRRVEVDPKTGKRKYVTVNTGFLNPLQDLFKPDRGLTEESVGDKVQSLFGKGPWMRMIQGAMTGRDDATGRNITTSMDGAGKVADYLRFVGEMWAPPWMPAIDSLGFKGGTQVQSRERVDVPNAAGQYKTADDQRSARWGVSQSSMTEPQMMRRIGQMTGSQLGSLSKSAFEYVQSDKFGSGAEQMINSPTRLLAVAIKTQHPGAIKRIQAYEDALRDKVPPVLQAAAEAIRSSRQPRYAQLAKALEDMQAKLLDPQARLGTTTMVVDRVLDKLRELQGQGKLGEVVLPALGGVQ